MEDQENKEKLLDELNSVLNAFFYSMKQMAHQIKCDLPLAEGQIFLLYLLREHGNYKVSELANRLGLTAGAVSAMTDKLIQFDLIQRERSEDDRRVVWISLTDKGKQVISEIQHNKFNLIRMRFGGLSEEDLKRATEVFEKLNHQLK